MVSDDMKRISDSNKLIMTNIYADKMRFENKRNKCDVVGFVNGNHVNKFNNENCNDENTMDDNSNGREGVANNRNHKCELRFKVGLRSNEGENRNKNDTNSNKNKNIHITNRYRNGLAFRTSSQATYCNPIINTKSRIRQVTWYAPPFSLRVKGLPKLFFKLLKENFPKHHKYYSICNKSTIKVAYSDTPNVVSIVASLNRNKIRRYNDRNDDRSFSGKFINDIEDSSNINSTSSEIDYEGRVGMTNNANSRNNHNNDVGDDISDYNDYQGGTNSVNCSDNVSNHMTFSMKLPVALLLIAGISITKVQGKHQKMMDISDLRNSDKL
ncbi:probable cyclin-dependent serine/threonine-protein kinase DDB_G0292550 [Octopus sinensis]|uniref:Probable cyclin-dependent serine/threonine-protein kinase DDB_G0292550 n=1 Tax=Octopus sinensis TaxID=2607531 RepID=A0A7E6ET98_9MOLL|nr:probable cyclin-dependent serine/threonine-protein kinase DDB_G0292550 [Octopus sinensis]